MLIALGIVAVLALVYIVMKGKSSTTGLTAEEQERLQREAGRTRRP